MIVLKANENEFDYLEGFQKRGQPFKVRKGWKQQLDCWFGSFGRFSIRKNTRPIE